MAASRFKIVPEVGTSVSLRDTQYNSKSKRVRTPVELIEARNKIDELEKKKVVIESRVVKELPIEVEKTIHGVVENELSTVRKDLVNQQQNLHDQLLDLKKQIVTANKERFEAQKEMDDLKYRFKQQQVQEEIRRTELYNAMMKTFTDPPAIIPTVTRIEIDKELSGHKFEFPQKPSHLKRVGYSKEEKERDILDHLLSNTKMIETRLNPDKLVHSIDQRPDSQGSNFDGTHSGIRYLSYFNSPEMNCGIPISGEGSGGVYIPDDIEDISSKYTSEDPNSAYGILNRNKKRLHVLDELENKQFKGRYDNMFTSPPSDTNMRGYDEEAKDSSYVVIDDLLDKINNAKRYLD